MIKSRWTALAFGSVLLTVLLLTVVTHQAETMGPAGALWQVGSETEPNNTAADANRLTLAATMGGQIPLADPGDVDFFLLATEKGGEYDVQVSSSVTSAFGLNVTILDSNQNFVTEGDISQSSQPKFELLSNDFRHYFKVTATTVLSEDLPYEMLVLRTQPGQKEWDVCEINDALTGTWSGNAPPGGPCPVSDGTPLANLNFVPYTDQPSPNLDYFVVAAKVGRTYSVETAVTPGVDTVLFLFPPGATDDEGYIAINDDAAGLGLGSRIEWTADSDGDYVIMVENIEPLPHLNAETYTLSVESEATDADLEWDECEINDALTGTWSDSAPPGGPCPVSDGTTIEDLNFVPYTDQPTPNPDYFFVAAKAGRTYAAETAVSSGVDTVLYLFPPGATDDEAYIATNDDAAGLGLGSRIEWTPDSDGDYVIKVENQDVSLPHLDVETYTLSVESKPTAAYLGWDDCEVNDALTGTWADVAGGGGGPCPIEPEVIVSDLNFVPYTGQPSPDSDFFAVDLLALRRYRIETTVTSGVDTMIYLYEPGEGDETEYVDMDDNTPQLGLGSRIEWATGTESGRWKIKVDNVASLPHTRDQTYTLQVSEVGCQCDAQESNWNFDLATLILVGETIDNLDFVPCDCTTLDQDYFKLPVLTGETYICQTNSLPGVSTGALIETSIDFCTGPSQEQCLERDSDVAPFVRLDTGLSLITYTVDYDGWLYPIIEPVGADLLPEELADLKYSLTCRSGAPTSTPRRLVVVPMTTPTPATTATPEETPGVKLYTIQLASYYDGNGNAKMDPGEGIRNVLARSYDIATGELVSLHYTDETGAISFKVPAVGPVHVSVPFFSLQQIVTEPTASIQIRVAPGP